MIFFSYEYIQNTQKKFIALIKNIIEFNLQAPKLHSNHYQKFAKYQRIYRRNISVGILRSKLPTETFRL